MQGPADKGSKLCSNKELFASTLSVEAKDSTAPHLFNKAEVNDRKTRAFEESRDLAVAPKRTSRWDQTKIPHPPGGLGASAGTPGADSLAIELYKAPEPRVTTQKLVDSDTKHQALAYSRTLSIAAADNSASGSPIDLPASERLINRHLKGLGSKFETKFIL